MTPVRQPIIAAIDPHRDDRAPAQLGLLLARLDGAPLILASAYTLGPWADPWLPDETDVVRAATERALEPARSWAEAHASQTVSVSTACIDAEGSPATAIHELAELMDAAAIVIGSSARGPVGRVRPGAVTDRLLHHAPCPVAVATTGFTPGELQRVGVGFLDRADGWAALTHACRLAESSGALLRVLTVRQPLDPRFIAPLAADQIGEVERARSEAVERTLRAGAAAVDPARLQGGEVLVGRPADELATASAGLDLLVCGSRQRGPVRTLVQGGVSHTLVRRAHCPVLVVPQADTAAAADDERPARRTVAS